MRAHARSQREQSLLTAARLGEEAQRLRSERSSLVLQGVKSVSVKDSPTRACGLFSIYIEPSHLAGVGSIFTVGPLWTSPYCHPAAACRCRGDKRLGVAV